MNKDKRFKVSIYIIIMAASISVIIVLLRVLLIDILHMSDAAATTLMDIGQVVAGAVGAIMIIVQLARESDVRKEQASIQEAQFLMDYNQAFIQDANMTNVEYQLETSMKSGYKEEIITDENKQLFINYLVYLEGLAPLILNNVLQLDHIDNLMAYRFFLAINNKEVQEKELMIFPDFYRGCFKLYGVWKKYRKERGYMILQEKQSLDRWLEYEQYIDSDYKVRKATSEDVKSVAEILYGTDPYIYPTAFKNAKEAGEQMSRIMLVVGSAYHFSNIKVAVDSKGNIMGAVCYYNNSVYNIDYSSTLNKSDDKTKHVCKNYFSKLASYADSEDTIYIVAICTAGKHRDKGIGKMLLKSVLVENHDKTVKLDVLCDNTKAIKLYEEYGFIIEGGVNKGYAYPPKERPDCYRMVRQPSDEWIIKKFE